MDDAEADHFVCTSLPHGGRVQVGPVTLDHARLIKLRIKEAASPSISYATWVDWRRLDQYPLLDINAFYAEVMGLAVLRRQPTLPLGQHSDHILIEELKRRGYVVPKKQHICDLTCQQAYAVHEYEAMARNEAWLDSAKRSLAARLGQRLLAAGALQLSTDETVSGVTAMRLNAVVVAPEARHA